MSRLPVALSFAGHVVGLGAIVWFAGPTLPQPRQNTFKVIFLAPFSWGLRLFNGEGEQRVAEVERGMGRGELRSPGPIFADLARGTEKSGAQRMRRRGKFLRLVKIHQQSERLENARPKSAYRPRAMAVGLGLAVFLEPGLQLLDALFVLLNGLLDHATEFRVFQFIQA